MLINFITFVFSKSDGAPICVIDGESGAKITG